MQDFPARSFASERKLRYEHTSSKIDKNAKIKTIHFNKWVVLRMRRSNSQKLYSTLSSSFSIEDIAEECFCVLPNEYRLIRTNCGAEAKSDGFEIALLCDSSREVVYIFRVVCIKDFRIGYKNVAKVLTWRSNDISHKNAISGLCLNVLFNYIVCTHDLVINASINDGGFFQVTQVTDAFRRNLSVYSHNKNTCETKKLCHDDVDSIKDEMWSFDVINEGVLFIVSDDSLHIVA